MGTRMGTSGDGSAGLRRALREAREAARTVRNGVANFEAALDRIADASEARGADVPAPVMQERGWRERLWTTASDTRLGVSELAEALDVSADWIYRRTAKSADDPLPHRKLAGCLVFRVGEIRTWIRDQEEVEVALPSTPSRTESGVRLLEEEEAA